MSVRKISKSGENKIIVNVSAAFKQAFDELVKSQPRDPYTGRPATGRSVVEFALFDTFPEFKERFHELVEEVRNAK